MPTGPRESTALDGRLVPRALSLEVVDEEIPLSVRTGGFGRFRRGRDGESPGRQCRPARSCSTDRTARWNARQGRRPGSAGNPRSNGARENQDARRGTFQDNQQNRRDGAGAGGDDARETFEENQDRRQDTFDDAQETREDGRRELADEAADLADDIRDGDEIFDDDDFRGDGDGLIDGDGWEADDNDLLKAVTIGAMRRSLPRNAQPQTVDGQTYYTDGTNWYQPVESPDGTSYQAVAPPQQ